MVRLWETRSGACLRTLRSDRHYERLDITGLTGITEAQHAALLALGAIEQAPASSGAPTLAHRPEVDGQTSGQRFHGTKGRTNGRSVEHTPRRNRRDKQDDPGVLLDHVACGGPAP